MTFFVHFRKTWGISDFPHHRVKEVPMYRQRRSIVAVVSGLMILSTWGLAAAGPARIGLHGGISIPNIRGNANDKFSKGFKSRQGPFFGIFAEFPLASQFSLVAELNYASQGGKRDGLQLITSLPPGLPLPPDTDLYADFRNETILDYVELPVLVRVTFESAVRIFLNAGPYVGYLVRARAVTSGSSLIYLDEAGTMPIVETPVSFDAETDVMDSLKRWNAGVMGGGGFKYGLGPGDIILEARFQYGLVTIQRDVATSGNSKTGAVVISLGYEF
jgi:hypothetical protein